MSKKIVQDPEPDARPRRSRVDPERIVRAYLPPIIRTLALPRMAPSPPCGPSTCPPQRFACGPNICSPVAPP